MDIRPLVAAGLLACAAPLFAQTVAIGPVAEPPPPSIPTCAAHPEARSTGFNIWSDRLKAPNLGRNTVTYMECSVTNTHPTKSLHAAIDAYNIDTNTHDIFSYHVAPGGMAAHSIELGPFYSGYCRITLTVAGHQDHADERQVRAVVTIVDYPTGTLFRSSQLR
jgi:hypothetical protein